MRICRLKAGVRGADGLPIAPLFDEKMYDADDTRQMKLARAASGL